MQLSRTALLFLLLGLLAIGCDSDDPPTDTEEEVITTLNYTLTPAAGGASVTMTFSDLDGDGGNDPVITGGTLSANTIYNGSMELLNESESPTEDITEEIEEADAEHQFFFSTNIPGLVVGYADFDAANLPVGLSTTVATGPSGTGNLTVTLRHEPDKSAAGVATGDIANAGGETDIEVTFDVNVQ